VDIPDRNPQALTLSLWVTKGTATGWEGKTENMLTSDAPYAVKVHVLAFGRGVHWRLAAPCSSDGAPRVARRPVARHTTLCPTVRLPHAPEPARPSPSRRPSPVWPQHQLLPLHHRRHHEGARADRSPQIPSCTDARPTAASRQRRRARTRPPLCALSHAHTSTRARPLLPPRKKTGLGQAAGPRH
jgi:hypothetical protein